MNHEIYDGHLLVEVEEVLVDPKEVLVDAEEVLADAKEVLDYCISEELGIELKLGPCPLAIAWRI